MDTERHARADLAARGRQVVASYLAGVDVAWADDDEDVVEILNEAGKLRRIRVSVTGTDTWLLPRDELTDEPEVEAGWWSFVRIRCEGHGRPEGQPEVYLAAEDQVRVLVSRRVEHSAAVVPAGAVDAGDAAAEHEAPVLADETVRVSDDDLRPILRSWRELTRDF